MDKVIIIIIIHSLSKLIYQNLKLKGINKNMTTETMTIHKALSELKVIGARIDKTISQGVYCKANKHSNDKINGVSVDEFKTQIQASWNKANDLISRLIHH